MPLQKTESLILRRIPVRDSSDILTCLTRDWGKISLVARATRRPGSVTAEALQYFTVAEIHFYQREKKTIDYISKAETLESFADIITDETTYGYAGAALELVNLFLPEEEANRKVYYLLKKYLRLLNTGRSDNLARELLHFWLRLCILSGYAPQLDCCTGCGRELPARELMISPERGGLVCAACVAPEQLTLRVQRGAIEVLKRLAVTDIDAGSKMAVSGPQAQQIKDLLAALTEYHVGRRADLKSFDFLRKLDLVTRDGGESGSKTTG